jgi:hypothetical protein
MHWPMLGLGGALVALAAILKLTGGASDLQQHAVPFWLFVAGLAGLFVGGWYRDNHRVALAGGIAGAGGFSGAGSSAVGHALASAGGAATAPAMQPAPLGGLSSLQRSPVKYDTSVGKLSEADVIERIRSLESENDRLRAFLVEANTSISRSERRHAPI